MNGGDRKRALWEHRRTNPIFVVALPSDLARLVPRQANWRREGFDLPDEETSVSGRQLIARSRHAAAILTVKALNAESHCPPRSRGRPRSGLARARSCDRAGISARARLLETSSREAYRGQAAEHRLTGSPALGSARALAASLRSVWMLMLARSEAQVAEPRMVVGAAA